MTEQDVNNALIDLKDMIDTQLSASILGSEITFDELSVRVAKEQLYDVVEQLKRGKVFEFTTLVDITAIDRPDSTDRFQVVYHFLSMTQNHRVRLLVDIEEDEAMPSICAIHASANWYEREVFDMFGIVFTNHPDLRRILTDYGFQGHPLRKDFPTTGYLEVRYDEKAKKVVYEPVTLVQEYRQFDFLSPWDGAKYILPGDEKSDA